jgi:hypothetical protein
MKIPPGTSLILILEDDTAVAAGLQDALRLGSP